MDGSMVECECSVGVGNICGFLFWWMFISLSTCPFFLSILFPVFTLSCFASLVGHGVGIDYVVLRVQRHAIFYFMR